MESQKSFHRIVVRTLHEDGTKESKYPEPVSLHIEYDPHGISCQIKNGKINLLEIPVDTKTECCKTGHRSYIFSSVQEDLMITFNSESDQKQFHSHIYKLRQGKESSVFNERTDDSSATQYFQFYSYLSQQQNMMQDYIRTGTYQRAILSNISDFKDKVILDVGAGSGILSFFAAQAGAKRVYAVEASSMAQHCETLVSANSLKDTIRVIAGKIEEIELPESVDMIISEPMGYMLYNERMLETYIHAKKWLKPGGKMFPSRGDLHVAPFCDETLYFEQLNKANFWYQNCFHGVDLCELREQALNEYLRQPIVDTFDVNTCLAKSVRYSLDFIEAQEQDLYHIDIPLEYHILKSSMLHGLAFWFDVAFLGSTQTVWLSTAPTEPLTHWYQVRCLFEKPIFVKEGQLVKGKVQLIANRRQSYDVKLEVYIEGTMIATSNSLDLKNPYFRYTGVAPQPPPGENTMSPSENYWHEVDAQGAKQDPSNLYSDCPYGVQTVNMVNGITVNGMGEVALDQGSSSLITLEMDSTLVVQQYIQQTIRKDHNNIDLILSSPDSQDEGVWKYEHLRQFCMELNGLAVRLQGECQPSSCTQMRHKTPKECPAIDYTRHTLDGAACLLNSNKCFPSRVSIKESSVAKLGSLCRRLYRIFSHAYFHHRHIFDEFENETSLCRRFTVFVTKYNLVLRGNLIVPILEDEVQQPQSESDA